jgi:hypothetical protein
LLIEVSDLPPGAGFLQARPAGRRGNDRQWAVAPKGEPERQHPAGFCGGRVAISMTTPDIRDMLK